MTKDELKQLDDLLVKFGAVILNRPYVGRNQDTKNEALLQRISTVRKHVLAEVSR